MGLVVTGIGRLLHTFEAATLVEALEIPISFRQSAISDANVVRGVRVFKAGAFKDSKGRPTKWSPDDLHTMVRHFDYLVSSGIFPNVPIRRNHTKGVEDVIGYYQKLYVDPEGFLAADIKFTEPGDLEKWNNGTYRARSLEIGYYETNDGQKFYPTVMGLAFVDIGAVEGLYDQTTDSPLTSFFALVDGNKEITPMDPMSQWLAANPGKTPQDWHNAVVFAHAQAQEQAWTAAATYAAWEQAASYAQAVDDHFAQASALGISAGGTQPPPVPAMPAFQIHGQQTTDYSAVQHELISLQQFRDETVRGGRTEFVQAQVAANKLPKTQEAAEIEFVLGMTDAQWNHYKTSREAVAQPALFGQYGVSGDDATGAGGGGTPAGTMGFQFAGAPTLDVATAQDIVDTHKRAGKSHDFIKATDSYKFLVAQNQPPKL